MWSYTSFYWQIKRLMKAAADEAKNPDAGFFELAKLENMLCLAEKSNFSENDLTPFRQVFNELQTKLNPVSAKNALENICTVICTYEITNHTCSKKLTLPTYKSMGLKRGSTSKSTRFRFGFRSNTKVVIRKTLLR